MSTKTIKQYVQLVHKYTPKDAQIGLTTIKGSSVYNRWYARKDVTQLIEDANSLSGRSNVYLRLTPIARAPERGRGLERDSLGSSVLWAELDCYGRVEAVLAAMLARLDPPTMVTASGNGLHAYWLLDRFYTDLDALKARNKRLVKDLDAEAADSCYDLARVLRVPGTLNIKREPHTPSTILHYDAKRVYSLEHFAPAELDDLRIDVWDSEPLPPDFIETVRERDRKLYQRIYSEDTAKKAEAPTRADGRIDRSRNDAYIATRLLGLGFSAAQILSVLTAPEWFSGDKYNSTARYDYVLMTVNAAYRAFSTSVERYYIKNTFIPERLATELDQTSRFIYTAERLWRYSGGVYIDDAEDHIKERVVKALGKKWSSRASDEVVRWITDQSRIDVDRVNNHAGLINVLNGMLDLESAELRPHDPRYVSLSQLPIEYIPNADTTAIDTFVAQILPADAIPVFWEYVGSALILGRYWPKAFLALVGPGDTGKSKLLEWLLRFYGGKRNVSAINLQTLADNKFASAHLFGKLANIFPDLDEGEASNTGQLKALTGDDTVSGEQKFRGFFMFKNSARLFFSANHYPRVRNPDEAFFRRAYILRCENRFTTKTADPKVVERLSTPSAFSGGLLRAFQGVQRLLEQNGFSYSTSIEEANNEYRFSADTVSGFLHGCVFDPSYAITKQEFYRQYRFLCEAHNRKPVSDDMFFKRVADNLERFGMTAEYRTVEGTTRAWYYIGRRPASNQATFITVAGLN